MFDLVVGCPVKARYWIIDRWFYAVEMACANAGIEPVYSFVGEQDDPTVDRLHHLTGTRGRVAVFTLVPPGGGPQTAPHERVWNHERFVLMVDLRNRLLRSVRTISPKWFWSVDSDILVHPDALKLSLDSLDKFDAVGGKCFMGPRGVELPSCGWYGGMEGFTRKIIEQEGVMPVGVIMALKLMNDRTYNIDYAFNMSGEDIGWSTAATAAGLKLGWDSRVCSKHVMTPDDLDVYDERCGW